MEILDGAIGTALIDRGVGADGPAWTATAIGDAPEVLFDLHRAYAIAGASLHTANTFRTQPGVLGPGWAHALDAAVELARGAIAPEHRLLGSIAPVEDCYRPDRSPGRAALPEHRRVARALADAGCDILLCETFAHAGEALAAVEGALETGLPVWLSLTAGPEADLLSPQAVGAIASDARSLGVGRILINCVAARRTTPYVEALGATGAPIGVYANAGRVDGDLGWGVADGAAERYAELAVPWVQAGATVLGGCCGTGPAHVRALRERFGSGVRSGLGVGA